MTPMLPHHRVENTRQFRAALAAKAPWRQTHLHPDRSLLREWAHLGTFTCVRTTTPATTLAKASRRRLAANSGPMRESRTMTRHSRGPWAGMTATLSAELEGRVAHDLVADIVRAVLDEGRQGAPDRAAESPLLEARRRLERFIRARSSN
jgi:hypothetical protein